MLDPVMSRLRQQRLLDVMQRRQLDAVVLGLPHHVYYFSAFLQHPMHQAAMVLTSDGRSCMIMANTSAKTFAVDDIVAFEAQWMATLRQDQPEIVADKVFDWLSAKKPRRLGLDTSSVSLHIARRYQEEVQLIDPELWQLRRCKDPDELGLMRSAIALTSEMYRRAKEIVTPGIRETTVFAELQRSAVDAAKEPLTGLLGNDFACGSMGGPPRAGRTAKAGEIYILDLGPSYRGYFADNARSFVVDREPTHSQLKAFEAILRCFDIVEAMARPGVRCRDLFAAADEHLLASVGRPLPHHLGHGVGLQAHEFPHLNPKWDDTLMPGDVFTVEPGVYGDDLAGGIRIEDQYLVTATGIQNLIGFSRDITRPKPVHS
jgi:Xaa-Pro dipeptidase